MSCRLRSEVGPNNTRQPLLTQHPTKSLDRELLGAELLDEHPDHPLQGLRSPAKVIEAMRRTSSYSSSQSSDETTLLIVEERLTFQDGGSRREPNRVYPIPKSMEIVDSMPREPERDRLLRAVTERSLWRFSGEGYVQRQIVRHDVVHRPAR